MAGFTVKLSENLQNQVFMDQITKIGVLVSFESLITPYGKNFVCYFSYFLSVFLVRKDELCTNAHFMPLKVEKACWLAVYAPHFQ